MLHQKKYFDHFDHKDLSVRYWAATHSLKIEEKKALKTLKEATKQKGISKFLV